MGLHIKGITQPGCIVLSRQEIAEKLAPSVASKIF